MPNIDNVAGDCDVSFGVKSNGSRRGVELVRFETVATFSQSVELALLAASAQAWMLA